VTEACVDDSTLAVELGCFGESVRRTFACLMPAQRMDGHIVAFRSAVRWTQAALGDVHRVQQAVGTVTRMGLVSIRSKRRRCCPRQRPWGKADFVTVTY
jgi:hypothetical protein